MRTHYILVDFENIQPKSLAGLEAEQFRVMLFVGASQTKVCVEIAAAMQKLGARAEYVRIGGNGPNTLDFHIAFHIGRLSVEDPMSAFHIISKDKGFDPLIKHLKERKIVVSREKEVSDIQSLRVANSKTPVEKFDLVVEKLAKQGANRPRTLKTLGSAINALFQKQLSEKELADLMGTLQAKGYVVANESRITYALPELEG